MKDFFNPNNLIGLALLISYQATASDFQKKSIPINSIAMNEVTNVTSHWFFIVPSQAQEESDKPSKEMVVHNGQDFGFKARFISKKKKIKLHVSLTVPNSPENFSCPKCNPGELTISSDRHTVFVDKEVDCDTERAGFYWGVDHNDPRGSYKLEFALDGKVVDSYEFQVK